MSYPSPEWRLERWQEEEDRLRRLVERARAFLVRERSKGPDFYSHSRCQAAHWALMEICDALSEHLWKRFWLPRREHVGRYTRTVCPRPPPQGPRGLTNADPMLFRWLAAVEAPRGAA